METETFNKNDKQLHFNQVKGKITELNDGDRFCSVTIDLGHENIRQANICMKKARFDTISSRFKLGDKVCVRYYLTSRKKNERWYTMANLLAMDCDE